MASPTIREINGLSLDLWVQDEEIFHANANIRERRFGGLYYSTTVGTQTLSPVFTDIAPGFYFGSGDIFGFNQFASLINYGLILDTITTGEVAPTFISAPALALFNGDPFGFIGFGSTPTITDIIATGEVAPTFISGAAAALFNGNEFGFLAFGATPLLQEIITTGEVAPILTTVVLSAQTFGSFKFGFGVFTA